LDFEIAIAKRLTTEFFAYFLTIREFNELSPLTVDYGFALFMHYLKKTQ